LPKKSGEKCHFPAAAQAHLAGISKKRKLPTTDGQKKLASPYNQSGQQGFRTSMEQILLVLRLLKMLFVFLHELINPASGINQLLFASEKGMAVRTDFDLHLGVNRTELNAITTGTNRYNFMIFWMDTFFHYWGPQQDSVV